MVEEEEDLIGNVRAGKMDHSNEFSGIISNARNLTSIFNSQEKRP